MENTKEVKSFLGKNYHELFINAGYEYINNNPEKAMSLEKIMSYPSKTTRWVKDGDKYYQAEIFYAPNIYIIWVTVNDKNFIDHCSLYIKKR